MKTSLYGILRASRTQRFPNYWELLWGKKFSDRFIKTLVGVLPLSFTTSEDKLRNWAIYGNAEGIGERTKNLISVPSIAPVTSYGVTFTFDPVAGTITANGTATGAQSRYAVYIKPNETINVYLSGCPAGGSSTTYNCYSWDSTAGARPKKWDGVTTQTDNDNGNGDLEVQVLAGHRVNITLRIEEGYTANNVVFKPMFRRADTTPDFIPYGYQVPITVSQSGQPDKDYDIFVGDAPLAEGETVSKTSTGIDIPTIAGNNSISTDLENKPKMKIVYRL